MTQWYVPVKQMVFLVQYRFSCPVDERLKLWSLCRRRCNEQNTPVRRRQWSCNFLLRTAPVRRRLDESFHIHSWSDRHSIRTRNCTHFQVNARTRIEQSRAVSYRPKVRNRYRLQRLQKVREAESEGEWVVVNQKACVISIKYPNLP